MSVRPPDLVHPERMRMLLRTEVCACSRRRCLAAQRAPQTFEQQGVRPIPIQLISHLIPCTHLVADRLVRGADRKGLIGAASEGRDLAHAVGNSPTPCT